MGIKRYTADADNTITNAYKSNLRTRATGSNMGLSDSMEVFRIYGQQDSGSSELSRILVQFPVSEISTDRTNGVLPGSGSVSFYLRLFNAKHPFTLPKDYDMIVSTVSRAWNEGTGLDMESYADSGSSNWTAASSNSAGVTAWTTAGRGYEAESRFTASFVNGTEDIELDVSDAVERWIAGDRTNYGFGIRLENEAAF